MIVVEFTEFGSPDVLRFVEVEKPAPADDELLVAVRAASVNPADWHFMRGTPYLGRMVFGLRVPKVTRFGADFSGTVEAVGRTVTRFKPGDAVFGARRGAFAGYHCIAAADAALKPERLTFEETAALPIAGVSALQALRDVGRCAPGRKVLITGASGGVGTFAVQIAHAFGADVTGVCSAGNMELVRSLGADRVIDYATEDFTRGTARYDLILYVAGHHSPWQCRRLLAPEGTYVMLGHSDDGRWIGPLGAMLGAMVLSKFGRRRLRPFLAKLNAADLTALGDLATAGTVRSVIDRTYDFREIPAAMRYLETGHAKGKVVIRVDERARA